MDAMPEAMPATEETDAVVLARARALVEYLLAVRAVLERPSRTVPSVDAFWEHDLPDHPAVSLGPAGAAEPWLRVGRPRPPADPAIPLVLANALVWDLSYDDVPHIAASATDEATVTVFDAWLAGVWRPWAALARGAEATRKLHDRLYDLRFRLDNEAERSELVWGHAILDARVDGHQIRYPLFATPVAIEYDADATAVSVVPQGPARLQPDALTGIDSRRIADLLELGGAGNRIDVDPWDAAERHDFADRAMRRLGFDPILRAPAEAVAAGPYVTDTGVLFLRPRQRMVRRFLEQMADRLERGDGQVGALGSVLAHEPSRLRLADDDAEAWAGLADRLLMPMATNEAQESIVQRLAEHRSVAVQGPPGTGKTHTIRNLICHLVANGKRVLVLAQKEDPLRVLRSGLPEEIQPLCLAVLGRSADQLVQLQTAARELSDRAATLDQDVEARWVDHLNAEIAQVETGMADAYARLQSVAERQGRTYPPTGEGATEIGSWLRMTATELGFIPDPIDIGVEPPLTSAAFESLFDIARRTTAADRAAALGDLPPDGVLPTGAELATRRRSLHDATKVVDALLDRGIDVDGVRDLGDEPLAELSRTLRSATDELTRREGTWADRLGRLVRDPSWQPVWDDHVAACQRLLADLGRRTTLLSGHAIEIPDERAGEPRRLLALLAQARTRLATDRKIGRLTQPDLARLMGDCTVDGEVLRTVDDIDLVIATIERRQLRSQLGRRWSEWSTRLDFPIPAAPEPEVWAGRLLTDAIEALDWDRVRWPALYERLVGLYPRCARDVDVRTLAELSGAVEACGNVLLEDRLAAENRLIEAAIAGRAGLTAAWYAGDDEAWDAALAEVARLRALAPDARAFEQDAGLLRDVAPRWTRLIERGSDAAALPAGGDIALEAWAWRQAQTWFDDTVGDVDTAELSRSVERAGARIRMLTRDTLIASAWLQVARTLDDRRRAALADWTAALRKIGKGTGKSAGHWQAVAQRAMGDAVSAVPVWVMSVDRALEQFHGGAPIFDVVIVDEASQADIFALPVLSLARRAVVVGDDQQIGPQIVGVPADRVRGLIATHLGDVPSAEHFDTDSSLYDHAVRRSPERILLTEHFRSVPAIISFSSNHYYDRKIQPLRADVPSGLGAAVTSVFVADGRREPHPDFGDVNVPEAEALVSRVVAIVADGAYAGKTLGVVSLLSTSGQAEYLQHRLRAEIGAHELERRALRVGDPYTFQGDERDVVLISMVAAGSGTGAFTKRDYHRRINVAASRARDQLWLFHSVQPAELPSDDARALLLTHCHALTSAATAPDAADPQALCTNEFEQDVLAHLLRRGLTPTAQFRLGEHRIDFVLHAPDGRRLAIECDGDRYAGEQAWASELRRQSILERVGNATFVRLRSSVFHREPEVALAPLWQRAAEMAILPAG